MSPARRGECHPGTVSTVSGALPRILRRRSPPRAPRQEARDHHGQRNSPSHKRRCGGPEAPLQLLAEGGAAFRGDLGPRPRSLVRNPLAPARVVRVRRTRRLLGGAMSSSAAREAPAVLPAVRAPLVQRKRSEPERGSPGENVSPKKKLKDRPVTPGWKTPEGRLRDPGMGPDSPGSKWSVPESQRNGSSGGVEDRPVTPGWKTPEGRLRGPGMGPDSPSRWSIPESQRSGSSELSA